MEESNNEKGFKFLAFCIIIIQVIFIGLFGLFFVGISRVNAADYTTLRPTSIDTELRNSSGNAGSSSNCNWNDLSSCNLSLNTTSNHRWVMKFNASYYASASNSISVNYVVGYYMNFSAINQNVNISPSSTTVKYNKSGTLYDVSDSCETTATKSDSTPQTGKHLVYYIFNTTCDFINPGGNATQLIIETPLPTSISNIYNVYGRIASYTLNRITGTITDSDKIIANNYQNTQWIINNIENSTSTIVNGLEYNTNNIINNQNENTDRTIDAIENQNINCDTYNDLNLNNKITNYRSRLNSTGDIVSTNNNYAVTDYIYITANKTYTINNSTYTNTGFYCLYDKNKILVSCSTYSNTSLTLNVGYNGYLRMTIDSTKTNKLSGEYCYNLVEKTNDELESINSSITDPSIDTSGLDGFDVSAYDGGISSIITAPLSAIQGILNNTCSAISVPIPFTNKNLTLPCLTPIYQEHFAPILTLWQTVCTGIIAYWICLNIFHMVHGFTDPTDDKIEVVDL